MVLSDVARAVAPAINAVEFDSPFILTSDGAVLECDGWAPVVTHDPDGDINIEGGGWGAMTGLTGQYGYSGAAMHASEFVGAGVAEAMLELCDDGPMVFAFTLVEVLSDDDTEYLEPAGWAIVYRPLVAAV